MQTCRHASVNMRIVPDHFANHEWFL